MTERDGSTTKIAKPAIGSDPEIVSLQTIALSSTFKSNFNRTGKDKPKNLSQLKIKEYTHYHMSGALYSMGRYINISAYGARAHGYKYYDHIYFTTRQNTSRGTLK
jgi:hypothetical protein